MESGAEKNFAAGTVGITPVTGIDAGVAALDGCNGDTQNTDLTGDWRGTWTDSIGAGGEALFYGREQIISLSERFR